MGARASVKMLRLSSLLRLLTAFSSEGAGDGRALRIARFLFLPYVNLVALGGIILFLILSRLWRKLVALDEDES